MGDSGPWAGLYKRCSFRVEKSSRGHGAYGRLLILEPLEV